MSLTVAERTLSVLVQDCPGVLARVSGLISRRGFNIKSLAVGGTEQKDVSRMTIVVAADDAGLEQLVKQLNKLINVLKIVEQEPTSSVARQIMLIKVRTDNHTRGEIVETVNLFRAKIIDVVPDFLTIEATGTTEKLDALLRVLDPCGIKEISQSGIIAMGRGNKILHTRAL